MTYYPRSEEKRYKKTEKKKKKKMERYGRNSSKFSSVALDP
jgi:hypothetical protein